MSTSRHQPARIQSMCGRDSIVRMPCPLSSTRPTYSRRRASVSVPCSQKSGPVFSRAAPFGEAKPQHRPSAAAASGEASIAAVPATKHHRFIPVVFIVFIMSPSAVCLSLFKRQSPRRRAVDGPNARR